MRAFALLAIFAIIAVSFAMAGVVELTGESYPTITGDKDKNVFVMVYATWCGHCQSLHPQYEKVAETFAGNDKVVIAKMDAPAHEDYARNVLSIRSFPTLFFYKNGVQQTYDGARSQQGIEEFINANL